MSIGTTPIDISNNPSLLRLAEEVEATKKPRKLMRDNQIVAILTPATKPQKRRERIKANNEAFRAAFGSWKDVDTERLLNDIYEDRRRRNTRPLVKL
jgi:hypothetical protein